MAAAERQAATEEKPSDPVGTAAREALDQANGDLVAATAIMEAAVHRSPRLRKDLTEPLIRDACYDAVRMVMRKQRHSVWNAPTSKPVDLKAQAEHRQRVVHLASGTLLMFPLPGGVLLRDADRDQVMEAAEFYGRQSRDMRVKERWLRLVAAKVPEGRRVGVALTSAELETMQAEASRHA